MALTPFIADFAAALIKAETPASASAAEAAQKFGDAFISFFENATVLGVPIVPGTTRLPSAVSVLVTNLTTAFQAVGAAPVSALMEAAFFAYWNAAPFTLMAPAAVSVAPGAPLYTYTQVMTANDPLQESAKNILAGAITSWLMAGPLITMKPPPPGTTTTFV